MLRVFSVKKMHLKAHSRNNRPKSATAKAALNKPTAGPLTFTGDIYPMTDKKAISGWTKIPNCLIEMEDLPPNLFRVYCVIMAQKKGYPITLKELSRRSNVCKNTVLKAVQILADVNLIEKTKEHGYANTYIGVQKFPVDNVCEKIREVSNRWIPPPTNRWTPKSGKTGEGVQQMDGGSPTNGQGVTNQWSGGVHSMDIHAREYLINNKTNYKTNYKTKDKNKECSAFKNFSFLDWQKEVAEKWAEHYNRVLPNMPKPHIEKWANEVRLIAKAYNLTHDGFMTLFRFVERDGFWRDKAESVMTLRKRNASGIPKIVNIMKAIPAFRTAAVEKAFADENLTDEQKEIREVLKNFGRKKDE